MAYQTGSASSMSALLGITNTFAQAHGFTLTGSILSAGASYTSLAANTHVTGGVTYQRIDLVGGIDSTFATNLTSTVCAIVPDGNFPITYYLFAQTSPVTELVCILSYGSSLFTWFTFGNLRKSSALYTGGNYVSAQYTLNGLTPRAYIGVITSNLQIGFTVDMSSGNGGFFNHAAKTYYYGVIYRNSFVYTNINSYGWGTDAGNNDTVPAADSLAKLLLSRSPNIWNSQTSLIPARITLPVASGFNMDLGDAPIARFLRMDYLVPGDIITIGTDNWMVFPFCKKDTAHRDGGSFGNEADIGSTGTLGWAFKSN